MFECFLLGSAMVVRMMFNHATEALSPQSLAKLVDKDPWQLWFPRIHPTSFRIFTGRIASYAKPTLLCWTVRSLLNYTWDDTNLDPPFTKKKSKAINCPWLFAIPYPSLDKFGCQELHHHSQRLPGRFRQRLCLKPDPLVTQVWGTKIQSLQ